MVSIFSVRFAMFMSLYTKTPMVSSPSPMLQGHVPHWLTFHPLCVIASHHPNSTIPSATRHADPHDPSLHSPGSETQTIGSTAPHHVEEADIISGLLSSTIYIPHPRRFPSPSPSPSPTTSSVDIDPQGYAVTDPTFHGPIEAAAPNPNRPVPPEAPHYSRQSSSVNI